MCPDTFLSRALNFINLNYLNFMLQLRPTILKKIDTQETVVVRYATLN